MLSMKMTVAEIEAFLLEDPTRFDKFWEPPVPRFLPIVGKPYKKLEPKDDSPEEKEFERKFNSILGMPRLFLLTPAIQRLSGVPESLKKVLIQHLPKILAYLGRDMGIFSGLEARNVFQRLVSQQLSTVGTVDKNIEFLTFEKHLSIFGKHLVLTGSNVSTGKTQIFSAGETAKFPVVDAVRISMGLPYAFKPYQVEDRPLLPKKSWPTPGTYVDGGWWEQLAHARV